MFVIGATRLMRPKVQATSGALAMHATQPKYQLRFAYGVGDIVVWDNAALLHSATLIDPADARTLWRITVLEPAPQAATPAVLASTFAA